MSRRKQAKPRAVKHVELANELFDEETSDKELETHHDENQVFLNNSVEKDNEILDRLGVAGTSNEIYRNVLDSGQNINATEEEGGLFEGVRRSSRLLQECNASTAAARRRKRRRRMRTPGPLSDNLQSALADRLRQINDSKRDLKVFDHQLPDGGRSEKDEDGSRDASSPDVRDKKILRRETTPTRVTMETDSLESGEYLFRYLSFVLF